MSNDIVVRKANAGDVQAILDHHGKMFAEMGFSPQQVRIAIERSRHEFYRGIVGNNFHAWLAKVGELAGDAQSAVVRLRVDVMQEIIAWAKRQRHNAQLLIESFACSLG